MRVSVQTERDLPIGMCKFGRSLPMRDSFHHRRSFGAAAVPSPIRSFGTYNKGGKPTFYVTKTHSANLRGWVALDYALSVYQRRKLARPPCETFRRNVGGMAGMPPSGGSPDWGIPCVPQRCPLAESMGVAEPARTSLRRTVCAACGAEFFLYEKMGRRAIVPAGSTRYQRGRN